MAAPRSMQFIALRNLARHGAQQQVRKLHMTGPATYASPVLNKERSVLNLPRDMAGLRAECKRRKIDPAGTKQDLVSRINADEIGHSRAFSTMVEQSKRPTAAQSGAQDASAPVRHFNTSRSLKAVNDTSTIDFAYMPTAEVEEAVDNIRVPLLHHNYTPDRTGVHSEEAISEPMLVAKPMISTMSADSVFLPMSEMHDGHADGIDFHAMADRVAYNVRQLKVPVEEQASLMKQIWSDMVDDIAGAAAKKAAAA